MSFGGEGKPAILPLHQDSYTKYARQGQSDGSEENEGSCRVWDSAKTQIINGFLKQRNYRSLETSRSPGRVRLQNRTDQAKSESLFSTFQFSD